MDDELRQHINAILAHLDEQYTTAQGRPSTTVIDVDVIEPQAEEPPTVESTLAPDPQDSQHDDKTPTPATPTPQSAAGTRMRPHWMWIAFVMLCLFLLGAGTTSYLLSVFTPSATITIVTASQALTTHTTLALVTNGTADPTKNQVAGHVLPSVSMSQQKTVPTTGTTHEQAQAAHGLITFYNGATSPQTIAAGTVVVGADGIPLVTNVDAFLPAALFPTFGQASVPAHAAIAGPEGNVQAGDVYGACCRLNVSAVNGAFTGGQDARTYQSVTPQDISSASASITTSLDQSIQAALQTQVPVSETLLTPLTCTAKVTPDHTVGEEAVQVSVTVDETCTGMTYSTQAVNALATLQTTQNAAQKFGAGYTTTGVHTSVTHASRMTHGMMALQVHNVSVWTYPFTSEQQSSIKAMIAGMNKQQAITMLLHLTGVQSVSLIIKNANTIPTNLTSIHLLFLQV